MGGRTHKCFLLYFQSLKDFGRVKVWVDLFQIGNKEPNQEVDLAQPVAVLLLSTVPSGGTWRAHSIFVISSSSANATDLGILNYALRLLCSSRPNNLTTFDLPISKAKSMFSERAVCMNVFFVVST